MFTSYPPKERRSEMDNFHWRCRVRMAAYFDLALSCVSLGATIINITVKSSGSTATITNPKQILSANDAVQSSDLLWAAWISSIIMALALCCEIMCAVFLLKTTKMGANSVYAFEKVKLWRNVNFALIILGILAHGWGQEYLALSVDIICRGCVLFITCKFIQELRLAFSSCSSNLPSQSVVILSALAMMDENL